MMFEVEVSVPFTFTHFLEGFGKEYSLPHEHTWAVNVVLRVPQLDQRGAAVDFIKLKNELIQLLAPCQSKPLNSTAPFVNLPATAENIAQWIARHFSSAYPGLIYRVCVGTSQERACYLVPDC